MVQAARSADLFVLERRLREDALRGDQGVEK